MNSAIHLLRARLIFLGILCSLLPGAWNAVGANTHLAHATQTVRPGKPFNLRAGQQVKLKGERLQLKFVAVENDSRCPTGVTCVWAGNAAVQLRISSGRGSKILTLNTSGSSSLPGEQQYQIYKVRLLGLKPYPRNGQKIAAGDYTATLVVSKVRVISMPGSLVN